MKLTKWSRSQVDEDATLTGRGPHLHGAARNLESSRSCSGRIGDGWRFSRRVHIP